MNRRSFSIDALAILLGFLVGCSNPTPVASTQPPTPLPSTSTPSPAPTNTLTKPTASPTIASPTAARPTAPATRTNPANPQIISFTVSPTTTLSLGEKLALAWEAKGDKAEVCGIIETGPTDCQPVPLAGKMTLTTTDFTVGYTQLGLRVTAGGNFALSMVPVMLCRDASKWFFDRAPARCPEKPATTGRGAAQNFERGFMIWLSKPDTFYVFYADGKTFEMASAPYQFKSGASPNNRVGETPPRGMVEPVSGFGQIWRGEMSGIEKVRQRLGWATAPEFAFDAAYQCAVTGYARLWDCYLKDPRGKVLWLHPDSSAGAHLVWDEY